MVQGKHWLKDVVQGPCLQRGTSLQGCVTKTPCENRSGCCGLEWAAEPLQCQHRLWRGMTAPAPPVPRTSLSVEVSTLLLLYVTVTCVLPSFPESALYRHNASTTVAASPRGTGTPVPPQTLAVGAGSPGLLRHFPVLARQETLPRGSPKARTPLPQPASRTGEAGAPLSVPLPARRGRVPRPGAAPPAHGSAPACPCGAAPGGRAASASPRAGPGGAGWGWSCTWTCSRSPAGRSTSLPAATTSPSSSSAWT